MGWIAIVVFLGLLLALPNQHWWLIWITYSILLTLGIIFENRKQQTVRKGESQNKPPEATIASLKSYLPHIPEIGEKMKISFETEVDASQKAVWNAWVTPEDITRWNFAMDEWCCPRAEINLEVGGKFKYRMEAKDGSMGFDFEGTFTKVKPNESIHYELEDNRVITIEFMETANGIKIIETFEAEDENSAEQQKQGWQSILNNFKKHVESKCH